MQQVKILWQAIRELGWKNLFLYASYQAKLSTPYFRFVTPIDADKKPLPLMDLSSPGFFSLPTLSTFQKIPGFTLNNTLQESEEILEGRVRIFQQPAQKWIVRPPHAEQHWTEIKENPTELDIKDIWEPARFGWVFSLGKAYWLTRDERYSQIFWTLLDDFFQKNPVNCGENWFSAQEVGLRLLALLFGWQAFSSSSALLPERIKRLSQIIFLHARRIPPTLAYARAQNNNHLLSEAIALYAAGTLFQNSKEGRHWKKLGWHWLNGALRDQISSSGEYIQHSMNYHRLMLHLSLLADMIARKNGDFLPPSSRDQLAKATTWLLAQLDPISGQVPNLGSNDGALLLPFGQQDFSDYRPIAQAASLAFLKRRTLPPGPWDELALWLGLNINQSQSDTPPTSPAAHRLDSAHSWATLRSIPKVAYP